MLLRETWSVAERVVAGSDAPEPDLPEGRICTEVYSPDSCWMELADRPGCYVWNPSPRENVAVTWSRTCSNGLARGNGRAQWYQNDELIQIWQTRLQGGCADGLSRVPSGDGELEVEGQYVNGERTGTWKFFYEGRDDNVVREEGSYVNGEAHGTWTGYDASGNVVGTLQFENGRQVGGSRSALEAGVATTVPPLHLPFPAARSPPRACTVTPRHQRALKNPF